jgi:DNA polymerase III subunit delta
MKPEELGRALADGNVKPVYFFYGDETFLMEREVKRFIAALVPADVADFNLDILYGTDRKGEEIAAAAQTLPMFAERRLVVVKRSEGLAEADFEALTTYLRRPSPTTCLLFVGKKPDLRRKFFLDLKKVGELVEFRTPYENQLPAFITAEAAHSGVPIAPEAVELLILLSGTNLQELASQIEKLAAFVGEGKVITLEVVREIASDTRVDTVFDLANALGEKQVGTALRKLQTVLRDGQAPIYVLNMLTRHFRQLWQLRELMARKVPKPEMGRAIGLRSDYFLPGLMKQAGNFTLAEFRELFSHLYETDIALKSSRLKPAFILERLFIALCAGNRLLKQ